MATWPGGALGYGGAPTDRLSPRIARGCHAGSPRIGTCRPTSPRRLALRAVDRGSSRRRLRRPAADRPGRPGGRHVSGRRLDAHGGSATAWAVVWGAPTSGAERRGWGARSPAAAAPVPRHRGVAADDWAAVFPGAAAGQRPDVIVLATGIWEVVDAGFPGDGRWRAASASRVDAILKGAGVGDRRARWRPVRGRYDPTHARPASTRVHEPASRIGRPSQQAAAPGRGRRQGWRRWSTSGLVRQPPDQDPIDPTGCTSPAVRPRRSAGGSARSSSPSAAPDLGVLTGHTLVVLRCSGGGSVHSLGRSGDDRASWPVPAIDGQGPGQCPPGPPRGTPPRR